MFSAVYKLTNENTFVHQLSSTLRFSPRNCSTRVLVNKALNYLRDLQFTNQHCNDTIGEFQPTMSTIIDKPEVVADELAIRSLVARFANSCSPPDYDAFSKLWVPAQVGKSIWTLTKPFEMAATGIDEISKMLHRLLSTREFFVQLVHSGVVDVDGDNASGRWILREVARGPGETYYNNFAIYEDRYVKSEGKWYFERRDYKYMFLDSSPFQGDAFSLAPS